MIIRLANLDDSEAIRTIYNKEVSNSTATLDLVPRTTEAQRAWMIERTGAYPVVVAIDGPVATNGMSAEPDSDKGEVVGFGSLSPYRERPGYSTSVEISVYVRQDQRGKGVGKLIVNKLVDLAGAHGFHTVLARIGGSNVASIKLHTACGFENVGVEREVGRKFGKWIDVTILQRMI